MVVLRKRSGKTFNATLHLAGSIGQGFEKIYHWKTKNESWRHTRWITGPKERWQSTSELEYNLSRTWYVSQKTNQKNFELLRRNWRRKTNKEKLCRTPSDLFYERVNQSRALRESAIESMRMKVKKYNRWAWSWLDKLWSENISSASLNQKSCFHRPTRREIWSSDNSTV